MGLVKKIERGAKHRFMWFLAKFLKAKRLDDGYFRRETFGKILVIRQHNQMGDMLLAIPAFRAIRETYPGATIGVVSSTLNRGVLVNNPYIDKLFLYDKRNALSLAPLVRGLRRERFDLVVVLHTVSFSFTSVALAVLSGAKIRIGSTSAKLGRSLDGSYLSLTLPLPEDAELAGMHESEHNLYPLRAVGIDTDDLAPVIAPTREDDDWAEGFGARHWQSEKMCLAVHPGAGKVENIWPPRRHAHVVNELNRKKPVSLVVVEGPRDASAVSDFLSECDVPAVVVRERTIGEVAALLKRADLVICNDTGIMHVAAAAGATTLAVFGPTDPDRWAPRATALHIERAPGGRLLELQPSQVVERATEILDL